MPAEQVENRYIIKHNINFTHQITRQQNNECHAQLTQWWIITSVWNWRSLVTQNSPSVSQTCLLKYLTSLASFPSYCYAKEFKLLQSAINPQQNDLDVVKEGKSQIGDKDCASYWHLNGSLNLQLPASSSLWLLTDKQQVHTISILQYPVLWPEETIHISPLQNDNMSDAAGAQATQVQLWNTSATLSTTKG